MVASDILNTLLAISGSSMVAKFFRHYGLVSLSIIISACLIWQSLTIWLSTKSLSKAQTVVKQTAEPKPSSKMQPKHDYPLFGEYIPNLKEGQEVPNTLLNLSLVGILKASNPQDSQALIKVGSQDEKLYVINDQLPGGAVLVKVLDDAILLKRNGQIEKLTLPKSELNINANYPPLDMENSQ